MLARHAFPFIALAAAALLVGASYRGSSASAATFVVDTIGDFADDAADGVCHSSAAGGCTLRAAIEEANARRGRDRIEFAIPGAGVQTVRPATPLPYFIDDVIVDGWSQGGADYRGAPLIDIDGALTSVVDETHGLYVRSGTAVLRGLALRHWFAGIRLEGPGGNRVQGCYIGIDPAGTTPSGNYHGVWISECPNNTIGGLEAADRNVISGGNDQGVRIAGELATGNSILGNLIGTTPDGAAALGNTAGITVFYGSSRNVIGSADERGGNVVSGNGWGIILGYGAHSNLVLGNSIGTDVSGERNLGNSTVGIAVQDSSNNHIGTLRSNEGNTIAFNGVGIAVLVADSDHPVPTGNSLRGNAIFRNELLGIDIETPVGVTPNDRGDADAGPNGLQNYPELTSAETFDGVTRMRGLLRSGPGASYSIDLYANVDCDDSGFGEGRKYLQTIAVETDADGRATFDLILAESVAVGRSIAATAVNDETRDTSELSRCVAVVEASGLIEPRGRQTPGDCNQDGRLDISDAGCLLGFLFQGRPSRLPCGDGSALDAGNLTLLDWQPDGADDISDAVAMLAYLFNGGTPHPLASAGGEASTCIVIPGCPDAGCTVR
jgi:CSLREA domain-containing protein